MTAHAAEFFTLDEVNRLEIIQDVVDRRLSISDRQCRRLLSHYREHGPPGVLNRRRGKSSPAGLARYVLNIIRERFQNQKLKRHR